MTDFSDWLGRSEVLRDEVAAAPLQGLLATLDHEARPTPAGTPLPPLAHWLHFLSAARPAGIGPDGLKRGGLVPPVPLPRRMWAGARLRWDTGNPLCVGDAIERRSRIAAVQRKVGRSGEMLFVTVRHDVHNGRGLSVTEEQDIVYRAAAQPGEAAPQPIVAETGAPWRREIVPDPVLLFRYSALTFNAHRIHYDRPYAMQEEGYPGLLVHGPLLATLLLDLVGRQAPQARVASFEFRAMRPAFDQHPFSVNGVPASDGNTVRLWAAAHDGCLIMQAAAVLA